MAFVNFEQDPSLEYGGGDFTWHDGTKHRLFDPGLAQQFLAQNQSVQPQENQSRLDAPTPVIGEAQIEEPQKMAMVQHPSPALQSQASDYLKRSGGRLGASEATDDGKVMTVETHPAAPDRGLSNSHPGVTVREPAAAKVTPEEQSALDATSKKLGVPAEDLLRLFQHEGGYDPATGFKPNATNPKSGAQGIFQLLPSQAKEWVPGGDLRQHSAAEQIAMYPQYLNNHGVQPKGYDDLVMANFAPKAVGKPDAFVAYAPGSEAAKDNPGLIDPATGAITAGSIRKYYNSGAGESGPPQTKAQGLAAYIQGSGPSSQNVSRTVTRTEPGVPFTPEDQAALQGRTDKLNAGIQNAYAPVLDAQAEAVKQGIARQQEIQQAQDDAANKEQAARTKYDASMQRVQQNVDAVMSDKQPPPFGGNIFASILASVAQGTGAYSAAINKTDNFAARAIDTALKRENDRWAQAHLDKQYKVKEEKELTRDQWFDYQTQKSERQLQQRRLVDHELQQQLGLSKNAETQRALNLMISENTAKSDDLVAALQRQARGKVAVEVTNEEKAKEASNSLADQNKRAKDLVDSGLATSEEVADARGGEIPVDSKDYQAYAGGKREGVPGRNQLDVQTHNLETIPAVLGFNFDPQTKKFSSGGGEDMVGRNPLTGSALDKTGLGITKLWHSKEENEKRAEARTRMKTITNAQMYLDSGRAVTKEEAQNKSDEFNGLSQEDQIKQLNELYTGIEEKKKALAAEFPGAEEAYNRRLQKEKEKGDPTQSVQP